MNIELSPPLALFKIIASNHKNDSWRNINPMFAETLRLAIAARLVFQSGDFTKIVSDYRGGYWMGPEREDWYTLACTVGHPSSVVSIEQWMGRVPFMLDGERIHVGKSVTWDNASWRCTSIESDFVRLKRQGMVQGEAGKWTDAPATVKSVSRAELESKVASDKSHEKAKREAEREANRPDPVELLPLVEHLEREIKPFAHNGNWRQRGTSICQIPEWLKGHGSDYKAAYKACESGHELGNYLEWIGLVKTEPDGTADEIRKRYSWPKVEAQIFRFVRECRGLPLKDSEVKKAEQ